MKALPKGRLCRSAFLHDPADPIRPDLWYNFSDMSVRDGLGEGTYRKAANPDPAKRGDLPFLKTIKIGKSTRIAGQDYLDWRAALMSRE